MYIEFNFGVSNVDDYFDLQKRLTDLLMDQGRITDSGIMLICAIGEIWVELYDGSMSIKNFLSKVRELGFPQDTVYCIDGKQEKLFY